MENAMEVKFRAQTENVIFARTIAIGFLVNLELPMTFINEIKTVISEAVTNAIVHGYNNNCNEWVELKMAYNDRNIYINVSDEGEGIVNIDKAREPLFSTKPDEERAGLGFTIMEVFTDQLEIISKVNEGTTIKMVKSYGAE